MIEVWMGAIALGVLIVQIPAVAILLSRLLRGPGRTPPLKPESSSPDQLGQVSVVVPTLNEADRVGPCLEGLSCQGREVREILVVDSHSTDGTPDLVKAAQSLDPRFCLVYDEPLPSDWVGRPWALHTGLLKSNPDSTWVLSIDADTIPHPGLVASVLQAAQQGGYDLLSLSPQFILKSAGEFWLQPALLMTLIYRFGPSGGDGDGADRVMANGQCFLVRRSLLMQLGGYTIARNSFCDDVTLARHVAAHGGRVGFFDGAPVLKVRMYEGVQDTWQGWGRSLDLKDASTPAQTWGDVAYLAAVQGLPLPLTVGIAIWLALAGVTPGFSLLFPTLLLGLNAALVLIRFLLLLAIAPSYDFSQAPGQTWSFWLSPLADPLAVLRIFLSSRQRPTQWRSRSYTHMSLPQHGNAN